MAVNDNADCNNCEKKDTYCKNTKCLEIILSRWKNYTKEWINKKANYTKESIV
jgi:hypothetical protein